MFTGIIEEKGKVEEKHGKTFAIVTSLDGLEVGSSIAVNGVCLTVTGSTESGFTADVSEETLVRTTMGELSPGSPVNLERPVRAGSPLGGHVVQGHIDSTAVIDDVKELPGSRTVWIRVPEALDRYLVEKGSVAVDGVSLTITGVDGGRFSVALIPHTLEATNLGETGIGDRVNIEVDILAKYVERLTRREEA